MACKRMKRRIPRILIVLFGLLFLYAINDMRTSAVTYNRGENRNWVYVFLVGTIIYLCICAFFLLQKENWKINVTPILIALFLITIWIFIVDLIHGAPRWTALTHLGLSSLWMLGYYFFENLFVEKKWKLDKLLQPFFGLFFLYVAAIWYYFYDVQIRMGRVPVLNLIYNIVVLLPWIFLQKNKINQWISGIVIICAVLSMKRGGIIIIPLMLMANLLIEANNNHKVRSAIIKIGCIGIALGIAIVGLNTITNGFLFQRFSAEQLETGSGRTKIYSMAMDNIINRNIGDFLIGLGSGSSPNILGTGCHNEWLEFMFSFGLIGICLYTYLISSIYIFLIRIKRLHSSYYSSAVMMFLYMLIIGMIGGIYFIHSSFFAFSFWGAMQGLMNREVKENGKNSYRHSDFSGFG